MAPRARLPVPSMLAAVLIIVLPLVFGRSWLSFDGDPGRHIRVGETILERGLFYHDPFSFTRPGAAFVPYEWLSEVLAALSVRAAGLPGLLVLTGTVLALTYAAVVFTLRRRGVGALGTWSTLLLVVAVSSVHWHARPHVFTFLGAALLMVLVDRAGEPPVAPRGRRDWRLAALAALLFAAWANLHGGVLYGLCVLAAAVVGDALEILTAPCGAPREAWRGATRSHLVLLAAAVVGSVCTPSGPGLVTHAVGYLGDRYLLGITEEYWSPNFHKLQLALLVVVSSATVLALLPRRAPLPTLAVIALNLGFSLLAVRNLPLFAIVALPLVAAEAHRGWVSDHRDGITRRPYRWGLALPVAAVGAMLLLGRRLTAAGPTRGSAWGRTLLPVTFNPGVFPVRAVDEARAAHLSGRIFHELMWGGYLLQAWPEQRVFIDGQTDFYRDALTREYMSVHDLGPGWRGRLAAWRIDIALLPTGQALAEALAHERGWQVVYCDSTAVIFVRDPTRGPSLGALAALPERCPMLPDALTGVREARRPGR